MGCTSFEYGNNVCVCCVCVRACMCVCAVCAVCACVRVCICERVLTLVFLRVSERSCAHGYAHKCMCVYKTDKAIAFI